MATLLQRWQLLDINGMTPTLLQSCQLLGINSDTAAELATIGHQWPDTNFAAELTTAGHQWHDHNTIADLTRTTILASTTCQTDTQACLPDDEWRVCTCGVDRHTLDGVNRQVLRRPQHHTTEGAGRDTLNGHSAINNINYL